MGFWGKLGSGITKVWDVTKAIFGIAGTVAGGYAVYKGYKAYRYTADQIEDAVEDVADVGEEIVGGIERGVDTIETINPDFSGDYREFIPNPGYVPKKDAIIEDGEEENIISGVSNPLPSDAFNNNVPVDFDDEDAEDIPLPSHKGDYKQVITPMIPNMPIPVTITTPIDDDEFSEDIIKPPKFAGKDHRMTDDDVKFYGYGEGMLHLAKVRKVNGSWRYNPGWFSDGQAMRVDEEGRPYYIHWAYDNSATRYYPLQPDAYLPDDD